MTYRNKRLLEACRELPCQICGKQDGTVVAAHSNQNGTRDGKGMGHKASDAAVASLCFHYHQKIDSGKEWTKQQRKEIWDMAHIRTMRRLIEEGILEVRK